jgi:molybdopterin synthase catalytic subunit
MTPASFVRGQGSRRIRVVTGRVIIGKLTPLHEPERLPILESLRASPMHFRCSGLTGKLRWLVVQPPASGTSWLSLTSDPLPIAAAYEWAVLPHCGAVVLFSGTVRDHALDEHGVLRDQVESLTYEAYDEQVVPRFQAIEVELRQRWPDTGRVVLMHRTGTLSLGESYIGVGVGRSADSVVTVVIGLVALALIIVIGLMAYSRRPRQDAGLTSFRRHIDALSPESRREVMDRVRPSNNGNKSDVESQEPTD